MAYKLEIIAEAKTDIANATEYYFNISEKVFKNFNKRLDEALERIEKNPFYEIKYRDVRSLPLKKFPYIILFEIDETAKTIYILSIFCTHQNPEKYP